MHILPGAGTTIQSCILLQMQNIHVHAHTHTPHHPVSCHTDSPHAPVMKNCVLHSRSATEPVTQKLQQRTPSTLQLPFSPPSPFTSHLFACLAATFPGPDKKSPCRCRERSKDNLTWKRAGEGGRTHVFERNKDGEKREQLCSCQRTTEDSDINLNILFKLFLHHRPWFISGVPLQFIKINYELTVTASRAN